MLTDICFYTWYFQLSFQMPNAWVQTFIQKAYFIDTPYFHSTVITSTGQHSWIQNREIDRPCSSFMLSKLCESLPGACIPQLHVMPQSNHIAFEENLERIASIVWQKGNSMIIEVEDTNKEQETEWVHVCLQDQKCCEYQ